MLWWIGVYNGMDVFWHLTCNFTTLQREICCFSQSIFSPEAGRMNTCGHKAIELPPLFFYDNLSPVQLGNSAPGYIWSSRSRVRANFRVQSAAPGGTGLSHPSHLCRHDVLAFDFLYDSRGVILLNQARSTSIVECLNPALTSFGFLPAFRTMKQDQIDIAVEAISWIAFFNVIAWTFRWFKMHLGSPSCSSVSCCPRCKGFFNRAKLRFSWRKQHTKT